MKAQVFVFRRANNHYPGDCKEASERYFRTGDIAQLLKTKTHTQNIKISFPSEVLQMTPPQKKNCNNSLSHTWLHIPSV